eukprot:maker-scaffold110_size354795-snap-gene-2.24 protein:Tk03436 transcript:maker-scaffold110_size354795-snap-gene-2.24-mRNA-1 annotation:"4 -phosphopantetheinyl transferase npt"
MSGLIVKPLLEVCLVLAQNLEKALLYFTLAVLSGLFISVSCLCGHWIALKLAPIEADRPPRPSSGTRRTTHGSSLRHSKLSDLSPSSEWETKSMDSLMIEKRLQQERNPSWVYVRETLV